MATAIDLIKRSLLSLGILQSGEEPSHEEAQDMLALLQDMISGWNTEHFTIFTVTTDEFPLVTGQSIYTYGPGGDFDTENPQSVLSCYLTDAQNVSYQVTMTYRERYNAEPVKGIPSRPYLLYWKKGFPLSTLFFENAPDIPYTAHLDALKPLSSPDSITTEIAFPPEYDRAIRYNLSIEAAPLFGVQVPQAVAALADRSLSMLKRQNLRIPVLKTEIADRPRYNIYSDT